MNIDFFFSFLVINRGNFFNICRDSISSLPEQSKMESVSINEIESKSAAAIPPFSVSSDIMGEVDLSCLSPAERNQIISVMKAAESEESNIIPPVSSLFPVSTAPLPITPVNGLFVN